MGAVNRQRYNVEKVALFYKANDNIPDRLIENRQKNHYHGVIVLDTMMNSRRDNVES